MNARQLGIFGLAALGLALAAPVRAAPDWMDASFIVVKRDRADEVRQDRRDERGDDRRNVRRDGDDERDAYGYGYERRKQKHDDDRSQSRDRR